VERVDGGSLGHVWLFSRKTLDSIPEAYDEIDLISVDPFLPAFLTAHRIGGIRLFQWVLLLVFFPVTYRLTETIARLIRSVRIRWRRRRGVAGEVSATLVPGCVRLLLFAVAIRLLLATVELPLLERQFWTSISTMLAIAAVVWALLMLNGAAEGYIHRRLRSSGRSEIDAMLRLMRRVADALVVAAGGLVLLDYFGFDPTAALAGLGIGGIAVALAAQKTLENVVGGVSIILDKAVRVGDALKLGDMVGTVDDIGLRSTRIRTLDRTILSVPNSQIANVNIETLSARDKFWFHHFIGLGYETTSAQMRAVVDGVRAHLAAHPAIDRSDAIRVRFFRFGPFSLDIEVFAYVLAPDLETFLQTQQELLLDSMEIVERAGATRALPSQTLHVAGARDGTSGRRRAGSLQPVRVDAPRQTAGSA
jgi:MscS family membrane protein